MIKPKYINIADNPTLIRDTFSMGVLNTNQNALAESLKKHEVALGKIAEERRKTIELNTLRKEVDEMKILLKQLLINKG